MMAGFVGGLAGEGDEVAGEPVVAAEEEVEETWKKSMPLKTMAPSVA